jgi:hypothetical protein
MEMSGGPHLERRACLTCGKTYALEPRFWHKAKDGFHAHCKRCRNGSIKKKRAAKRNEKLEEIEKGAVDLFLASARVGGANIPHSAELLEVLMRYFGGAGGFANAYMKQFFDAPSGGAFRTKMLDTVVRLVQANTAMGGAQKPLEFWTEEELQNEQKKKLLLAAQGMKLIEVTPEPVSAPAEPERETA